MRMIRDLFSCLLCLYLFMATGHSGEMPLSCYSVDSLEAFICWINDVQETGACYIEDEIELYATNTHECSRLVRCPACKKMYVEGTAHTCAGPIPDGWEFR